METSQVEELERVGVGDPMGLTYTQVSPLSRATQLAQGGPRSSHYMPHINMFFFDTVGNPYFNMSPLAVLAAIPRLVV